MPGFSSMFTLAMVSLPAYSPAISSSTGATMRHGPHHSAQKSTRTGTSACNTSAAKLASVTVLVLLPMWFLLLSVCPAGLRRAGIGLVDPTLGQRGLIPASDAVGSQ